MKNRILQGLLIVIMFFFFFCCGSESKKYKQNDKFNYKGLEIIFKSNYKTKNFCSTDSSKDCYDIQIPFEISNNTSDTYDISSKGPFFTIYTPSGISISAYNGGYLDTYGQSKMKSGAKINDILRFEAKESGIYTIEIKDSKIEVEYEIELK